MCSDGVFVWNKGADLYEPTQKALIRFSEDRETLVLQVRYEGPTKDFGWLLPVPAKPEVSVIESEHSPFAELSMFTQERLRLGYLGRGSADKETVKVISRSILGIYDVAVLSASDPAGLADWLSANGYRFPSTKAYLLKHYTDKQWFYVALRIDPEALETDAAKQLNTGEIQPLRIRFRSDEPVYPFKITSANAGETELLLYVLADKPMVVSEDQYVPGFSVGRNLPIKSSDADPTFGTFQTIDGRELPLTWKAAQIDTDKGLYLMKYRATFSTDEIVDDLVFQPLEPEQYWRTHLFVKAAELPNVDRNCFIERKTKLGRQSLAKGDSEKAMRYLDEAILAGWGESEASSARYLRGYIHAVHGDYASAISDFDEVPGKEARNAQAWLYATCPDPQYRDGKRAIRLAEWTAKGCRWPSGLCKNEGEYIDTLAAAYAEDGQFDKAVSLLTELTEKLGANTPEPYLRHLQSYKEKRPLTETWR